MPIIIQAITHETYSFTPNDGGQEIHILSGLLRQMLLEEALDLVQWLEFPATETEQEMIERHGLEANRIASMTELEACEPLVLGQWGDGSHILIDGGHRRLFWARRGVHRLRGWNVPEYVWREFTYDPQDLAKFGAMQFDTGELLPQRRGS